MATVPIECTGTCTVTVQLEPAPVTPEKLSDISEAFGLMLMVTLLIWGARQMYRVFNGAPHDEG
jgi:hypothetical protein